MKGIILFLIVLIFTGDIYGFDYSAYKLRDLDEIIKESKAFEPEKLTGQSLLMPPHAVHLYVKLASYPFKCDTKPVESMLAMASQRTVGEVPQLDTCMQVESKNGERVGAFIQKSISGYIKKEYNLGGNIHIWGLWLFVNSSDKKPYFIINAIGAEPPDSAKHR